MKREGRQHGMVQTFWVSEISRRRPQRRAFSSPTTANLCTKVSNKPNNHSKYTSRCRHRPRCGGCHSHPPCKSMGKVKGVHKVRAASRVWRVVDGFHGLKFSGFSASGVLDYLGDDDDYIDHDQEMLDCSDDEASYGNEISPSVLEIEDVADGFDLDHNYAVDEDMSFCEVEFVWELMDEDESWFLVEEI